MQEEQKIEKYIPTKGEIACEMVRMAGKGMMSFVKGTGNVLSSFFQTAGYFAVMPYTIPSVKRRWNDPNGLASKDINPFGIAFGIPAGVVSWGGQIIGYRYLYDNGYGELCFLPLATNVASGMYEVGRCLYTASKENLVQRYETEMKTVHQETSLESRIENSKHLC